MHTRARSGATPWFLMVGSNRSATAATANSDEAIESILCAIWLPDCFKPDVTCEDVGGRGLSPTRRGDVVVVACVTCYSYGQIGRVTLAERYLALGA